jgi:hypothetical protein
MHTSAMFLMMGHLNLVARDIALIQHQWILRRDENDYDYKKIY